MAKRRKARKRTTHTGSAADTLPCARLVRPARGFLPLAVIRPSGRSSGSGLARTGSAFPGNTGSAADTLPCARLVRPARGFLPLAVIRPSGRSSGSGLARTGSAFPGNNLPSGFFCRNSAFTAAVPHGHCTHFPILPASLSGSGLARTGSAFPGNNLPSGFFCRNSAFTAAVPHGHCTHFPILPASLLRLRAPGGDLTYTLYHKISCLYRQNAHKFRRRCPRASAGPE